MSRFKKIDSISGWIAFAISAIVYLLTIEPTASFWDCGEFIATAFKLEVGHPPGAPFFMLVARFFTLFAGDVENVAMMVNAMSALASAFTILFLFWTITHLARKFFAPEQELSNAQIIGVIASGFVGALAYTFSDTFWFSAVEGEVYAMSSLFTAVVFWAILKWENVAHEKYANRWLILIAYLMGLSIGVHLLNLLAIPAIVFVYYFKKYEPTRNGIIAALAIAIALLGGIMYVIIPGVVKGAAAFELLFVNSFGLPYKSGFLFFLALIIGLLIWGIWFTLNRNKVVLNTILTGIIVILIGYSSFSLIVIRSMANPPMDENNPANVFSLLNYLNREQYGDRPLFKGQYFNAPVVDDGEAHTYIQRNGKYVKSYLKPTYEFDERFETVFPRMYSPQEGHAEEYKKWADIKGNPVRVENRQTGEQETLYVPTFGENLKFFFTYQVNFMYWRYFMWNFVGRQDDIQSQGGVLNGNWISGIPFVDEFFLGNQEHLTNEMKNHPSRNTYYFLPLILGLIGLVYQFKRNQKDFWVVMLLFVLTGLAIVVYLNQTPIQPRERDYAYAGSFYAFAIWIGFGVLGIANIIGKKLKPSASIVTAAALSLCVPVLMGAENWDDHDRSGRYTARDFAHNYLNSCEPNAIIFTNGDNDTFPLWYAQEVEGIRTDVRVVNLSLLGTDWYVDQMKNRAYESAPLPISMESDKYVQGTRDIIYFIPRVDRAIDLKQVIDFIASDKPETKYPLPGNETIDYIPTKQFKLTVDKELVLKHGAVKEKDADLIVPEIVWTVNKSYIQKSEMIILDIIANNNWERPIYFVSPYGDSDVGLRDYLQLEGFAYKLVPIKTPSPDILNIGRIDSDNLYKKYMETYMWRGMQEKDVFIDHNNQRTAGVLRLRHNFTRLANQLIAENKKDSAIKVLDRIVELMPQEKYPYDFYMIGIAEGYYKLNETEKADSLLNEYIKYTEDNLKYLFSLTGKFSDLVDYDKQLNLQIMQELSGIADKYGQPQTKTELEQSMRKYMELYFQGY